MAQFRAVIEGVRGEVSRLGSKRSGILGHVYGWNTGARVILHHDKATDKDVVRVYRTGGSNSSQGTLVAQWVEGEDAPSFFK